MEITKHALERARSRLKLNERSFIRLLEKVSEKGYNASNSRGLLRKYINKLLEGHENKKDIKIYGEILYIFQGDKLITLYSIPVEYKKYLQKLKHE